MHENATTSSKGLENVRKFVNNDEENEKVIMKLP